MAGNPWSGAYEEKVCISSDELKLNNSSEWVWALENNYDNNKNGKFVSFRCDNKENLLEVTKEYRCFLKLILNEKNKYGKYLGILEYRDGYPFVNNKQANNYNNYTVENYYFIRKDRDIGSTMKMIYKYFVDELEEEDIVLEILNNTAKEDNLGSLDTF